MEAQKDIPQQEPIPNRTGRATLITRGLMLIAVLGTLAIITAGILQPRSSTSTSGSGNTSVGTDVGKAAPNFTLRTPDGKLTSLSDYRGKPVMLNFWYSTCPGCQVEIPDMQKFYATQQAAGKDFVILGVNITDDATTTRSYIQEHHLTYPIVLDSNLQVDTLYNVNVTPTSFFIDRQGIIRGSYPGPVDDSTMQKYLSQMR